MSRPLPSLFVLFACALASASAKATDTTPSQPRFDLASPVPYALTQVDEDGSVWARGPDWKAHFERGSVEFRGLGSRGETPVRARLRLASASIGATALELDRDALPALDGQRVSYDRGGWLETYDLSPAGIEQGFVFPWLPERGDLSIRIALETALCPHSGVTEIALDRDDRRGLRYGALRVVDAAGRRLTRASRLEGSEIVLEIPRAFVATAEFPLIVDPLISTRNIDGGADLCRDADVAFDATTSRWLVVYERAAGDEGDVISRRLDIDGNLIEELAVDITNDDTIKPAVANNNTSNQFLIVWQKKAGFTQIGDRIRGRTRSATSTAQGAIFNVSSAFSANESAPAVGGSPNSGDDKYLVVWETGWIVPVDTDIRARTVSTSSVTGPTLDIDTDGDFDGPPAVTKSCGPAGIWAIGYDSFSEIAPTLAFVDKTGSVLATKRAVPGVPPLGAISFATRLAGDGRVFGATWNAIDNSGRTRVLGSFFTFQGGLVVGLAGTIDLTAAEPGASILLEHRNGGIETDGLRFTYTYGEQRPNTNDFDIIAATVDPVSAAFAEAHVPLGPSIFLDSDARVASTFGSGSALPSRCLAVWNRQVATTNFDVVAGLYAQP